MISRRYYHSKNQPDVHFTLEGKMHSGKIEAFWEDGIQLSIHEALPCSPHQRLTGTHFANPQCQIQGPDLQITQILPGKNPFRIETRVDKPADVQILRQALTSLGNPSAISASASVDITKIPQFTRRKHYQPEAVSARIQWAEAMSGTKLNHMLHSGLKPEALAGNIENYIGTVQIPVGVAGPLLINGVYANGYIPLPIATTEGALISSITRGAQTCNEAGGIIVSVRRQTMVRAPVFFCSDMDGAINLERWIQDHIEAIRDKAESFSSVARLVQVLTHVFDNTVHVQFYYSTGDASGQNMTSACTLMACRWIKRRLRHHPHIGLENFMIEGNLSGDKKANFQNFSLGRGITVTSTCRIPGPLLKSRLRISPERFVRYYQAGEVGALQAGMVGANINFANIIAGLFSSTGQDIACVHESALGYLKMRQDNEDLVVSAYLPSIVIGTVGGGTQLPTQAECLALMGCAGAGKAFRFAEIIGAACLALDLSTAAAVATNEFVHAHEHFGRNRPNAKLAWSQIDTKFFSDLLDNDSIIIESVTRGDLDTRNGIISDVAQSGSHGVSGLFRYHLRLRLEKKVKKATSVLKIKPSVQELVTIGVRVARLTGDDTLGGLFESQFQVFNLKNSNIREIGLYQKVDRRLAAYMPRIYGTRCEHRRNIFAILMEDLSECFLLNTGNDPSKWQPEHIKAALAGLSDMHAVYWNGHHKLPKSVPIEAISVSRYKSSKPLLQALTRFNAARYPDLISNSLKELLEKVLDDLPAFVSKLEHQPMTLTHNDFNPRNLCFRTHGGSLQLVAYDWELATYQNPQHDVMEFLLFTLAADAPLALIDRYADDYYRMLLQKVDHLPPRDEFFKGFYFNAVELALNRFNLYLMGHNLLNFEFMNRVYGNLSRYLLRDARQSDS